MFDLIALDCNKPLFGEVKCSKRSHRGQKKQPEDTVKASLRAVKVDRVDRSSREQPASDGSKWRGS